MRAMTHPDGRILLPSAANFMRRQDRANSISAKRRSCKSQRGQDRFAGQARVGFEGLFDDFTRGHFPQDEVYGHAGAPENRLAHQDIEINVDVFSPVHPHKLFDGLVKPNGPNG